MQRRPSQGPSDLDRIMEFVSAGSAATDGCGWIHPGDVPHRMYGGNRNFDIEEMMSIFEVGGEIAAFVLAEPGHNGFDLQIRPDLRTIELERELLQFAEEETIRQMDRYEIEATELIGDSFRCDLLRRQVFAERGWSLHSEAPMHLNRRSVDDLEEPVFPDGYSVRRVRGVEEAAPLAEVHAAAFGSAWTAESYARYMETPGYEAEREFVVEAPDGSPAAFCMIWLDRLSRTGYFEPVGTHPDHQRRGLARAMLLTAMRAMAEAGMKYATVESLGHNKASQGLYAAAGFEPWQTIDWYSKPIER